MPKDKKPPHSDFNLNTARQHAVILSFLILLPLIVFWPTTIGGNQFLGHDSLQYQAAAQELIDYRETHSEEPLWATKVFSGMPATTISLVNAFPHLDTIGSSLFFGIFPAFPYWVLLIGCYFAFLLLGTKPFAAGFGSILFGFTTYLPVIIGAGHNTKLLAIAFIPWVLAGYLMVTRSDKKWMAFFVFTLAVLFELRANHPQITYNFLFLFGALYLWDSRKAFLEKKTTHWAKITGLLCAGVFLALLANIDHYWQLWEYTPYSMRGGSAAAVQQASGLDLNYAFRWSQGISETFTLLIPDLFGGASPDYWGGKPGTSGPHYFGALGFLFLIPALFKVKKPVIRVFLGVGILGIFFAWGRHFSFFNEIMFNYLPLFNKFRAPETWLVLTTFSFAAVSVFGVDWVLEKLSTDAKNVFKSVRTPVSIVLVIGILILITANSSLSYEKAGEFEAIAAQVAEQNSTTPNNPQVVSAARGYIQSQLIPARKEKATADGLRFVLICAAGAGLLYLASAMQLSLPVVGIVLLVGVSADMATVGKRYIPENRIVDGSLSRQDYIERNKRPLDSFLQQRVKSAEQPYSYRVLPLLDNPFNNNIPSYFYPSIGGYTAAKLSIYQDAIVDERGPFFNDGTGINMGMLSMLNGKYITYPQQLPLPGIVEVYSGADGKVFENTSVLPKAFFPDSITTTTSPSAALAFLANQFNAASVSIIETNAAISHQSDSIATAKVITYEPKEIVIEAERANPGILVLSEIYYPAGWKAFVNEKQVPILKANYLLRAVELPAGKSVIRFEYTPSGFVVGGMISIISNVLILLIGVVAFMKSRK